MVQARQTLLRRMDTMIDLDLSSLFGTLLRDFNCDQNYDQRT